MQKSGSVRLPGHSQFSRSGELQDDLIKIDSRLLAMVEELAG